MVHDAVPETKEQTVYNVHLYVGGMSRIKCKYSKMKRIDNVLLALTNIPDKTDRNTEGGRYKRPQIGTSERCLSACLLLMKNRVKFIAVNKGKECILLNSGFFDILVHGPYNYF